MSADIPADKLLWMYRTMVTTRKLYETMYEMYRHGSSLGNFVAGEGEEAIPAAICANLRREDSYKPNFRQTSCLFAKEGYELADVFSGALFDAERGYLGFSLALGEDVGVYTGFAAAAQMRKTGQVCVCTFGEGTASKGSIHEAMVIAASWKLPIVFVLQNNQYCGGTRYSKVYRFDDLADRARGYGIPGRSVDGNDVVATYEVVREFVERARAGGGPGLIVAETYRLSPYFERAPGEIVIERYRPDGELEEARGNDPIPRFRQTLADMGLLTDEDVERIDGEVDNEIARAISDGRQRPRVDYEQYIQYAVAEL